MGINPRLLTKALTIRRSEERLLELFAEGKLFGTVHTCIGQEWVAVAVAEALQPGDYIFSNHRGHGHYLARTDNLEGLVAELMGRSSGICGGRGGSQHLCDHGFFSNGIQGGLVPEAAGMALAQKIKDTPRIVVVFIGDGTLGQGAVYETLNIAAKWSLPLLIVLEDNGIAQSTVQAETLAGTIKGRAHAFGIDVRQSDTWHPEALIDCAQKSARLVRLIRRPVLLHVKTYRLKAHSKGDDDRDPLEIESYTDRDILNQIIAEDKPATRKLLSSIDHRLKQAVDQAYDSEFTVIETDPEQAPGAASPSPQWESLTFEPQRVVDAIRNALAEAMADDRRIILLGEDIRDPYGGAFKVTKGLSSKFSDRSDRIFNTPISEAAIVGLANGLALADLRPVVEIMFGDFLLLAADQIVNHAAKFAWMYDHQVCVPMVIRTPMGGYRGYGPTHSQCLEKHLLGVPGTRVLAVHKRYCPGRLYRTLLAQNDRPALVIEHKLLYGQKSDPTPPAGCELTATDAQFPTIRITPTDKAQLTIVTYGGMVGAVESAITKLRDEEELACELLIPTQLYPLDIEPMAESVHQTGRLLVVEEGQGFAGFGSELIARLASDRRLKPIRAERVNAAACPVPASKPAELTVLPGVEDIFKAATTLVT